MPWLQVPQIDLILIRLVSHSCHAFDTYSSYILRMARNKHEIPCLKLSTFPINYQSLNGPSSILINETLSALAAHPDWLLASNLVFFSLKVKKSPLTSQCQIWMSSYSCFLCHVYKDLTSHVSPVSCKNNNLAQLSYFLCSLFSLSLFIESSLNICHIHTLSSALSHSFVLYYSLMSMLPPCFPFVCIPSSIPLVFLAFTPLPR